MEDPIHNGYILEDGMLVNFMETDPDNMSEELRKKLSGYPATQLDIVYIRSGIHKQMNQFQSVQGKLDMLNEITIKNGGGRHVTYKREEFFQMMHDQHSFAKISSNFYKYGVIVLVILQIIQLVFKK